LTSAPEGCRLYLLSPPRFDLPAFIPSARAALDGADIAAFQLRLAEASDDDWKRAAEALRPLTEKADCALLLDDRPELVEPCGADGVHLSGRNMSLTEARALLGTERMIGAFCRNSKHFAMVAAENGADYVSFGPFFGDLSTWYPKEDYAAKYVPGPELLTWWQETIETPCVAAGGITPDNGGSLAEAGADFLCVSSSVWNHPQGPAAAARAFQDALSK
jgi:thiamine-phosphate pyrophosphorylase